MPARTSESWTTLSAAVTAGDGSTKRHSESKNSSVRSKFSPLSMTPSCALLRSQGGSGAGMALSACPTCRVTKIHSHLFRVLLLRRLQLPAPLTARTCQCGRPLDSFGHHRAACARAGVLARRVYAFESVAARICREAGGRVSTNVFVRDLDLMGPGVADGRRLEMVALFGGSQIAVDATPVSALHSDGTPLRRAAAEDGVALPAAALRKSRTYPELVGPRARARLVVMGVEVGGRWAPETRTFLSLLARAEARGECRLLQRRAEQAWRLMWGSLLSCAAARAFASTLLELSGASGADDQGVAHHFAGTSSITPFKPAKPQRVSLPATWTRAGTARPATLSRFSQVFVHPQGFQGQIQRPVNDTAFGTSQVAQELMMWKQPNGGWRSSPRSWFCCEVALPRR